MSKPSGSFVLWDNTLCNPLAPVREKTRSAWEDGYASGVAAERKRIADRLDEAMCGDYSYLCEEIRSGVFE